ncbi:hemerythrin domain-containing protein [Granulosicoccus antarcticus]|uniref:DNA nickase n=1 Tax=Granulosicoccus antarcticus IMCC3135 TaxID=1192854 RepID=A0A2Z2NUV1_9GAMM|nr:hemerythrin domain-containing protein [Granulosicoccus antarcticus]ASJ70874.1 DNA nickase [Granulosicoccus antarcticus IMCC3135]
MTTTIYERIIQDHTRHRELLNKLSETSGDSDDRQRAWNEFYYDVKSHAAAEEETFYSRLMADTDGQDDARHSVSEHKELDDIIGELHEMEFSSPVWLVKFKTLKHDYEHHMDEEESDIFEKAREVFDKEESGEIGKAFVKRKIAERELVDEKAEASLEE